MAITRGNKSNLIAASGSGYAVTWSANPTAGQKILIALWTSASTTVTNAIDNGTSPTTYAFDLTETNSSGQHLYILRGDNITLPASGSYTVTLTVSGSSSVVGGGIAYSGVNPGGPTATNFDNATSGTSISTNGATPNFAGALAFAAFTTDLFATTTISAAGGGFTNQFTELTGASFAPGALADQIISGGPSAETCTWTAGNSASWVGSVAVYDVPGPVTVCGSAAQSVPAASAQPPAGWRSLQVPVTNTAGHWMVAIVTWQQSGDPNATTVHVGDDSLRNWWEPLGQPSGTSSAAGFTRTAIWAAPAAYAAQNVLVAPTGTVLSLACTVLDVSGLLPWQTLTAVSTAHVNAGTALSALTQGAPASQALIFTACGGDLDTATVSLAGSGWISLPLVSSTDGADHDADITLSAAWQFTTGSTSATWSSSGSQDLAGIIAGVLVSGTPPVQASPDWPVTVAEVALNAGPSTPEDVRTWTPISARTLALNVTQGRQYNLSALTSAQGTTTFDNPDGALIPPGTGTFAGIDSGTPYRLRMIWPASSTPYGVPFSGFVRSWPQAWDPDLYRGVTQATVTDAWAYCNANLQPILLQEILNDSPYAYWACIDPAGSSSASNYAPGNGNPLVVTQSKYGTGTIATQAFGTNTDALLGAQGTLVLTSSVRSRSQSGMWEQVLTTSAPGLKGYSLTCTDAGFPSPATNTGVTVECWFQLTAPLATSGQNAPLITAGADTTTDYFIWNLTINTTTGLLTLSTTGSSATQTSVTLGSTNYLTGTPPLTHVALAMTATTYVAYVNGVAEASGSWGGAITGFTQALFNGTAGNSANSGYWSGYLGHVAIFPSQLTAASVMTHYQAGVIAMVSDTPDARIERLLQAARIPVPASSSRIPARTSPSAHPARTSPRSLPPRPSRTSPPLPHPPSSSCPRPATSPTCPAAPSGTRPSNGHSGRTRARSPTLATSRSPTTRSASSTTSSSPSSTTSTSSPRRHKSPPSTPRRSCSTATSRTG